MDAFVMIIAVYGAVIGTLLVVMLCGESSAFPPLRWAHWFLTRGLWLRLGEVGRMCCGNKLDAAANYLCNTNHPLMSIFYLVLVWGGVGVFCVYTLPWIPNAVLPAYHLFFIPIAIALPNIAFYLASHTPPGIVTAQNAHEYAARYPYDDVVYGKKECSTCILTRPARTKHCSLCGVCVARFDHHCAWINNCVGEQNHRLFLAFLLSTSLLCAYGAYLCAFVLVFIVEDQELFSKFVRGPSGEPIPVSWDIVAKYVMLFHSPIVGVGIFMAVISFVLYLFFLYHCYLIARGTSTAETFKFSDAVADLEYWRWRQNEIRADPDRLAAASAEPIRPPSAIPDDSSQLTDGDVLAMDLPPRVVNIYNKGILANFRSILRPPPLATPASWPSADVLAARRPRSRFVVGGGAKAARSASASAKAKGGKSGKSGKRKKKTN